MRNIVQRCMSTLAAAVIGATLLLAPTTVANAQPATGAVGPAVCPLTDGSPVQPNSCGPHRGHCSLNIGDPIQFVQERVIRVGAGMNCTANFTNAVLIVKLYSTETPIPVNIRQYPRIAGSTLSGTAQFRCNSGDWYGEVEASVQWTIGDIQSYGPLTGNPVPIRCLV